MSHPVPPQEPVGGPAGTQAGTAEAELKRVVGLLLSTQQELIDLRYRRDREHRVLEGIVGFTEGVLPRNDKQSFWEAVVDSTVQTFDCEVSIAAEWNGEQMELLSSRGPGPADEAERKALCRIALDCVQRRVVLLQGTALDDLRLGGQGVDTLMVAPLDSDPDQVSRLLIMAVTKRKKPFFPRFDELSVPGLKMFASTVTVLREMIRSRVLIEGQVQQLDRAKGELERRMEDQQRSAAEQEQLRAQLAQSRRMESIGRLAGGVAHDFNNLLMVICGNTELMKTDPSLPLRHQEAIAEVLEASRRAQALTQQLLMFSRKQVIRPVPTELNRQIEESLRLYRRLIGEDITLTFSPCLDETPVLADQQQFDQLLGNLLLNARDAIHEQPVNTRVSEIRVSTQLVRVGSPLHAGAPAVRLTVADTGVGMDDETRQNIFEPFFTTKEVGKGTGLGLSTVLGVIQQNHGVIEVESAPGRGSTFHVYWPMHREVAAPVVEEASLLPTTGSEHVLLVEDEDQVRTFMVRGLNRLGFSVTACSSGEHALQMLADGAPPPDVLVTDVVMPRMNGSQLADKVQAHFPGLPVLFVSGYTDDIVAQQGIVREGVELLEKPFSPDTLGRRIRRLLDVRRSA